MSRRWLFKTKDELQQEAAERAERERDKAIRREAKYYQKLIPDVLARMGIDHMLPRADRPTLIESKALGIEGRQKIKIIGVDYNDHAIYLWVDTRFMPYRTILPDLHADGVLETLTDACMRQVVWKNNPGCGAYYIVWRDGAVNAIPALFKYNEAVQMIPDNAPPLFYIAGISENNRLIKVDLAGLPHLLVAGSTFTGKSVHLNQLLCQLISRNSPATLQLMMIDLKGGSEFAFYENLPHLIDNRIVSQAADVPDALERFQGIMRDRMARFSARGVKNLEGWNATFKDEQLPYVVLVFDELSLVMSNVDRKLVKESTIILNEIMATSRSTGGHVVLCTQRPSTDVIPAWIKANANGRVCFAVPSNTDSIVVIDNGAASKIDPDIPGRAILSKGPKLIELQSPFISDHQIREIVRQAIDGGDSAADVRPAPVTLQEILEESIDNYGGALHADRLFEEAFRGRITRDRMEELIKSINGDTFTIHGHPYRMQNKGRGRHGGRRLVPVGNDRPLSGLAALLKGRWGHSPRKVVNPVSIPGDPPGES